MKFIDRLAAVAFILATPAAGYTQSCNIDLDLIGGSQQVGGGAPSQGFGAAAGQPGYWNAVSASGPWPASPLQDLAGGSTGAQILGTGGIGSYGGFNFSGNTEDFALLLNDSEDVGGSGPEIDFQFTGFLPGHYSIFCYCVNDAGHRTDTWVTVPGSPSGVQDVTGPMPGNSFALGITHSRHELDLTGNSFEIDVRGTWPYSQVNGFQLVYTAPEPAPSVVFGAFFGAVFFARRRRS